jgi:SAM-dependent methyltransferase
MDTAALSEGSYASKQLFSPSALIRWSHRRRFRRAVEFSAEFRGLDLLDFGCGDATYLALLMASPHAPRTAVGAELHAGVVEDNRRRFGHVPGLGFEFQADLFAPAQAGRFDAVVCMEVLEHIYDTGKFLRLFAHVLRPGGRLLVSVPVETGPAVLVKQSARTVAGWRGARDYPGVAPYTWGQLARAVFAGRAQHIPRDVDHDGSGNPCYGHKGFNWRGLRDQIARHFEIGRVTTSPLPFLPAGLSSQVWLHARKPAA